MEYLVGNAIGAAIGITIIVKFKLAPKYAFLCAFGLTFAGGITVIFLK